MNVGESGGGSSWPSGVTTVLVDLTLNAKKLVEIDILFTSGVSLEPGPCESTGSSPG